jgi:F-type H+-transporting ATPase subunit epsilon
VRTFVLHLQSATQYERVANVVSFVGEDASGSFGILAGHERLITILSFGLARYRTDDDVWEYLAIPGGLVDFVNDELLLSARRYLRDRDPERVGTAIREQLRDEEEARESMRRALARLEDGLLRRLREIGRRVVL